MRATCLARLITLMALYPAQSRPGNREAPPRYPLRPYVLYVSPALTLMQCVFVYLSGLAMAISPQTLTASSL
jgi:hypothetical protein